MKITITIEIETPAVPTPAGAAEQLPSILADEGGSSAATDAASQGPKRLPTAAVTRCEDGPALDPGPMPAHLRRAR